MQDINYKESNSSEKTLTSLGKTSNGIKTNFDDPATTDEGIFEMADDYGISYYYRGAVDDNYVLFANFFWRIIRINGDGSLRIIYDGTVAHSNGDDNNDRFSHINIPFNTQNNDAKYVGWMYGPEGTAHSNNKEQAQTNTVNSNAKDKIDEWYKTNILETGYDSFVSDTLFCNDRDIVTGTGYSNSPTNYRAYYFTVRSSADLSFKCTQKNDRFTVKDIEKGNGNLIYPVGIITANERLAAGSGLFGKNNNSYYLYKSSSNLNWTMTPFYVYSEGGYAYMALDKSLPLGTGVSYTKGALSPVINLTSEYAKSMIGSGTINDPYRS